MGGLRRGDGDGERGGVRALDRVQPRAEGPGAAPVVRARVAAAAGGALLERWMGGFGV